MKFFSHERDFVCTKVFFLTGACLLKNDSLNRPKSVSFKRTKGLNFRSKVIIVIVFVVPTSNDMEFSFLETHFKFGNCK